MNRTKVYISKSLIKKAKHASSHEEDIAVLRESLKTFEFALSNWASLGEIYTMKNNMRQLLPPENLQTLFDDSSIPFSSANHGFLARLFTGYSLGADDYGLSVPNDLFKHVVDRVGIVKNDRTISAHDRHATHFASAYINAGLRCFTRFAENQRNGFEIYVVEKGSSTPKPLFR